MSYEAIRSLVLRANLELPELGLVDFTWGNVSARDPATGVVAIKPSGVPYGSMKASDIVVVDIQGRRLEGELNPSSDLATHLALYRAWPGIGGVVHTHSRRATAWAQACRGIPAFGTTHADYFRGEIPCTRQLTAEEIARDYEGETGTVIVERFAEGRIDPVAMPAALVASHGPFAWGTDAADAVHNAAVLELLAGMALDSLALKPDLGAISERLLAKHFDRKHGSGAYYGQKRG